MIGKLRPLKKTMVQQWLPQTDVWSTRRIELFQKGRFAAFASHRATVPLDVLYPCKGSVMALGKLCMCVYFAAAHGRPIIFKFYAEQERDEWVSLMAVLGDSEAVHDTALPPLEDSQAQIQLLVHKAPHLDSPASSDFGSEHDPNDDQPLVVEDAHTHSPRAHFLPLDPVFTTQDPADPISQDHVIDDVDDKTLQALRDAERVLYSLRQELWLSNDNDRDNEDQPTKNSSNKIGHTTKGETGEMGDWVCDNWDDLEVVTDVSHDHASQKPAEFPGDLEFGKVKQPGLSNNAIRTAKEAASGLRPAHGLRAMDARWIQYVPPPHPLEDDVPDT
eukprot:c10556_g1_i3.p1 GENE.c10556_g1_i3~~c10556_g1_i3.p1  ORF type:complete len:332 (-),score=87.85 c10556_g1_i3:108-1103(-)